MKMTEPSASAEFPAIFIHYRNCAFKMIPLSASWVRLSLLLFVCQHDLADVFLSLLNQQSFFRDVLLLYLIGKVVYFAVSHADAVVLGNGSSSFGAGGGLTGLYQKADDVYAVVLVEVLCGKLHGRNGVQTSGTHEDNREYKVSRRAHC